MFRVAAFCISIVGTFIATTAFALNFDRLPVLPSQAVLVAAKAKPQKLASPVTSEMVDLSDAYDACYNSAMSLEGRILGCSDAMAFKQLKPDIRYKILLHRSHLNFEARNWQAAIEDNTSLIALKPNGGEFYFNRAKARSYSEQLDTAIADLKKFAELKKDDASSVREAKEEIEYLEGRLANKMKFDKLSTSEICLQWRKNEWEDFSDEYSALSKRKVSKDECIILLKGEK